MEKRLFTSVKNLAVAALLGLPAVSFAQEERVTIFNEDFGTASSKKDEPIEEHVWNTNDKSMFSWEAGEESSINVRTNNASDYDGASADGNLYFKGAASLTISGIDTEKYQDLKVSFGVFGKNSAETNAEALGDKAMADAYYMRLECTAEGAETTEAADFSKLGLSTEGDCWEYVSDIDLAPTAKSLTLRFTSSLDAAADGGIRLDDIKVTGKPVASGISEATNGAKDGIICLSGRTLRYMAGSGSASVYTLTGAKVAEVKAGQAAELDLTAGVYVVKAGGKTIKAEIR